VIKKQIEIIYNTTISLYKDVMKCSGRKRKNKKRKGGVKVHTVITVDETVHKFVWFKPSTTHDHVLRNKLKMKSNII